ncbi:MAG: MBL fold metallo-hydrolase [Burkholderiaceae bacterium]
MLRFRNLGSGSSGNATLVEARSNGSVSRLLIDCGLGIRQLDERMARAGLALSDIDAIFITHEHSDHIGCARQLALRHRIPVWMSCGTHAGARDPDFSDLLRIARDGVDIALGELCVTPFTVPHDAREPLQLRCTDGNARLGILTDLGHATAHVLAHLSGCDALLLECNHDPQLLEDSPYPVFLKRRVGGTHGHLSNDRSAAIASALNHPGLSTVVAAHLSRENNRPDLARAALADALGWSPATIGVADPVSGTDWLSV